MTIDPKTAQQAADILAPNDSGAWCRIVYCLEMGDWTIEEIITYASLYC